MLLLLFPDVNGQKSPIKKIVDTEPVSLVLPSTKVDIKPKQVGVMDVAANIDHAHCTGASDGAVQFDIAVHDLPFTYAFEGQSGRKAYGSYWRLIEVDNPGNQLSQFQVKVEIPESNKFNTDFSDIRVTDTSLTQLYSYWFEEVYNGKVTIWVKLPVIPPGKSFFKVFYGNSAASALSNGKTTFDYFEDFEESDFSEWSTGCDLNSNLTEECTVSLNNNGNSGNYLQLRGTADCIGSYTKELQTTISRYITLDPGTYSFDYSSKLDICLYTNCAGETEVQTFAYLDNAYISEYIFYITQEGSCGCKTTRWFQSRSDMYTDDGNGHQYKIISELWDCSKGGANVDNFRIRKNVANPPVVTTGPEQSIIYSGLKAGTYTLILIDAISQELKKEIVVTEPALPHVNTPSTCGSGKVEFKISGAYSSYKWYDGEEKYMGTSDSIYSTAQINETSTFYLTGVGTNGCESTPKVEAIAKVVTPSMAGSIYADKKDICPGDSVRLHLTNRVGKVIGWELSVDSINYYTNFTAWVDTSFTLTPVNTKTYIKTIIKNEECVPDTSDVFVVKVHEASYAFVTGADTILPHQVTDSIKLVDLRGSVLEWHKSYDIHFNNYSVISTPDMGIIDSNLMQTVYYRVKVQNEVCTPTVSNVVSIRVNRIHKTYADTITVLVNSELVNYSGLLSNDVDPDGDQLEIKETDWLVTSKNGKIKFSREGILNYIPAYNFIGTDSVTYTVCDKHQSHLKYCVAARLVIKVERSKQEPLHVFNAISPNGDNSNDSWVIQGIENYPENEVYIYDRWGNLVFEERGYDNSEDKKWKGTANAGMLTTGQQLPAGTYYYLINIPVLKEQLTGYIELHR